MEQLEIYAALFCLEYKIKPEDIHIELRIYQNDDIEIFEPTSDEINNIINKIKHLNKVLENVERRI